MTELKRKMTEHESYYRKLNQLNARWPIVIRGTTLHAAGGPALACTLLAVAVCIVHYVKFKFTIESQGHTITIFPVSLLLVFRTNISHSRYWEGRAHIGALVHHCRDLLRKCRTYFPEHSRLLSQYVVCFPRAVRWDLHSTVGTPSVESELPELAPEHRELLSSMRGGWPMVVLRMLEDMLDALSTAKRLHPSQQVELHSHVDGLQAAWEGMRKIQTTPLPFPYAHLAKFLIYCWCLTLPFGLVKTMTYLMPFTVFVMSLSLFGLNQVGVEIEMPFGVDLNDFLLTDYEKAVERDAEALTTVPVDASISCLFPNSNVLREQATGIPSTGGGLAKSVSSLGTSVTPDRAAHALLAPGATQIPDLYVPPGQLPQWT